MLNNMPLSLHGPFERVTIADLTDFQIAIPTTSRIVKKQILSTSISVPEPIYSSQGWLICDRQLIAYIKGLEVGTIFAAKSPFKSIKRLDTSIPISFNTKSVRSLPKQVSSRAAFACQFEDEVFPYRAIFRHVIPRFVSLHAFPETSISLLERVEQMLAAENLFIRQNYERLKRVPFYQKSFGL